MLSAAPLGAAAKHLSTRLHEWQGAVWNAAGRREIIRAPSGDAQDDGLWAVIHFMNGR
jgi:hypothetical protein